MNSGLTSLNHLRFHLNYYMSLLFVKVNQRLFIVATRLSWVINKNVEDKASHGAPCLSPSSRFYRCAYHLTRNFKVSRNAVLVDHEQSSLWSLVSLLVCQDSISFPLTAKYSFSSIDQS